MSCQYTLHFLASGRYFVSAVSGTEPFQIQLRLLPLSGVPQEKVDLLGSFELNLTLQLQTPGGTASWVGFFGR